MSEGIKHKYNVTRVDGKNIQFVWVLEPERDPIALKAMIAYANLTIDKNPVLSRELMEVAKHYTRVQQKAVQTLIDVVENCGLLSSEDYAKVEKAKEVLNEQSFY